MESGTRSDKTQISFENAVNLRQLVQSCFPQERANTSQVGTGIIEQMSGHLWGVRPHAAELGHAENSIVATHAVRPVEYRAFGAELYRQGSRQDRKGKQRQCDDCQGQVEKALYHVAPTGPALRMRRPIQHVGSKNME